MKSYVKSIVGQISQRNVRQEFFFFNQDDPVSVQRALSNASAAYNGRGILSVWGHAQGAMQNLPIIGEPTNHEIICGIGDVAFQSWRVNHANPGN